MLKKIIYCLVTVLTLTFYSAADAALVDVFETPGTKGYKPWNAPQNIAMYNAWLAAIQETPDFREDWDGLNWKGKPWEDGKLFDIQDVPTAIFQDGVTFGNIGSASDKRAIAEDNIGSTDAIDKFGWRAHESGVATADFSKNGGVDYLSFYIFDTDHDPEVLYRLVFSDNTTFDYDGLPTDEGYYRFVGFVNQAPSLRKITQLKVYANDATRYGIDEFEWGRLPPSTIPEPATMSLFMLGGAFGAIRKWKRKNSV